MTSDRERWDARHRSALEAGDARRPPAELLLEHSGLLAAQPRGRALDVACGLGRNTLHLARMGFAVDAADVSGVAVEHVAAIARREGLAVRARRVDLGPGRLPVASYEVVVNCFFLDRRLLPALAAALVPGGLLLFETFIADPVATTGPRAPAHVLRPGELHEAFADELDVLAYEEGPRQAGRRATARLAARRTGASGTRRGRPLRTEEEGTRPRGSAAHEGHRHERAGP